MNTALNQAKQQKTQQTKQQTPAAIVNSPALDKLQIQIQDQADQLEIQARQIVRDGMAQAKAQVRSAITEELAAVAGDDDFFGISLLFGEGNQLIEGAIEVDTVAN